MAAMTDAICSVDGCNNPAATWGWCRNHYERERRAGRLPSHAARYVCSIPDCGRVALSRGWCDTHYRWWKRTGSPVPSPLTADQRFLRCIGNRESRKECWPWLGHTDPKGYGRFKTGGKYHSAHRMAYELLVGPIPLGLTIDHLCRNHSCVNPYHLEVVSLRENILRSDNMAGRYARRATCSRGHSFDPPNGYLRKDGARGCHACDRIRYERRRAGETGASGVEPSQ